MNTYKIEDVAPYVLILILFLITLGFILKELNKKILRFNYEKIKEVCQKEDIDKLKILLRKKKFHSVLNFNHLLSENWEETPLGIAYRKNNIELALLFLKDEKIRQKINIKNYFDIVLDIICKDDNVIFFSKIYPYMNVMSNNEPINLFPKLFDSDSFKIINYLIVDGNLETDNINYLRICCENGNPKYIHLLLNSPMYSEKFKINDYSYQLFISCIRSRKNEDDKIKILDCLSKDFHISLVNHPFLVELIDGFFNDEHKKELSGNNLMYQWLRRKKIIQYVLMKIDLSKVDGISSLYEKLLELEEFKSILLYRQLNDDLSSKEQATITIKI